MHVNRESIGQRDDFMKCRIFRALAVLLSVSGCSEVKTQAVSFKDVEYMIPRSHLEAFVPPNNGRNYARISPPNKNFILVVAERDAIARNWQGGNAPLVTHINDAPAAKFESFEFPDGQTVCKADIPHRNCGLRVYDEGVGWAVIFDEVEVPNSSYIRDEALKIIKSYR
jgi:hypothetical protein